MLSNLLIGINDRGTFLLSGGTLAAGTSSVNSGMILGDNGSIGMFLQSGGTDSIVSAANGMTLVLGDSVGSTGLYSLTGLGSTLMVNGSTYVGGTNTSSAGIGLFNISGGSAAITGTLKVEHRRNPGQPHGWRFEHWQRWIRPAHLLIQLDRRDAGDYRIRWFCNRHGCAAGQHIVARRHPDIECPQWPVVRR